jgi:hypothetical protein
MGVPQVLTLSAPIGRIFVDDPTVLDINPLTDSTSSSTAEVIRKQLSFNLRQQDQVLTSFIVTTSESRVELGRDDHSVTDYQCSGTDCELELPTAKEARDGEVIHGERHSAKYSPTARSTVNAASVLLTHET